MLYLQEIFDDLAYGELANMAIGNSSVGSITPDKYPKIVSLINTGLNALYTRFCIKKKELVLYQRTGISTYYLRIDHLGDPRAGYEEQYIDELVEDPPDNDIIKILEAYDDSGNEIAINQANRPNDIFMPAQDIIQIKPRDPLIIIFLVYQAAYPRIIIGEEFDPKNVALFFPRYLKEALLSFIAARLFVGKSSQITEGQQNPTNTFRYQYEIECNKIEKGFLIPELQEEDNHFQNSGWV